MDAAGAIEAYFRDLLMQRDHGIITVMPMTKPEIMKPRPDARGFVICLTTSPFLEVVLEDGAVTLHVTYPSTIAYWDPAREEWQAVECGITPLPKDPKKRNMAVRGLGTARVKGGKSIKFDLYAPDSLSRAEFYVQTIITKVRYMVTNSGWRGLRAKDNLEFPDLIDEATREFDKKVLAPTRKKPIKGGTSS